MKKVQISVSIKSPFYGELNQGAILKDNGDSTPTLSPSFNLPPFAKRFSQFDIEAMVQEFIPHYNCEEEFDVWTEEEQTKIKKVYSDFHNSYTRIEVEPNFESLPVDALTAKRFRTSFEVPNDKVQEAIEFCQGGLANG